eukprot:2465204-Ditylum_brightwellii.AAC.1
MLAHCYQSGPKKSIRACDPTSINKGETASPTKSQLIKPTNFSKPDLNHQFSSDVVSEHILVHLFKSDFLDDHNLANLLQCHPLFSLLLVSLTRFKQLDVSSLQQYDEKFEQQHAIPFSKIMNFAASHLHHDFHIPPVIRYAGNNYPTSYRDVNWILNKIKSIVPSEMYAEVK